MTNESHSATKCPICESSQTTFFAEKGGYSLSKCPTCTFIFVDPLPPADVLADQYTTGGGHISEFHYPKAKVRFRRAMVRAARLAPKLWGRDVIDIGCGRGFNVEAMRRFGARAAGLDISPQRIAYAARRFPKNRFYCEGYEHLLDRELQFDFVYTSQLLEHLPDVNEFADVLWRITRPRALVYVKTPDRNHWRVPNDVTSADIPSPPRRKQYFNKESLRALLEKHGFEVRKTYFKINPSLHLLVRKIAA